MEEIICANHPIIFLSVPILIWHVEYLVHPKLTKLLAACSSGVSKISDDDLPEIDRKWLKSRINYRIS